MADSKSSSDQWIEFGTITRPHGVRGELRLVPSHPASTLPVAATKLRLRGRGGERVWPLQRVRRAHDAYLVSLEGIDDRDAAAALAGAKADVEMASLPALASGELYLYELRGARAETPEGVAVGTVRELLDNNGQDLLVLDGPDGERLLPFTDGTLVRFDRERKVAVLRIPDGLWGD